MELEKKTVVWLTAGEVHIAIRAYVRATLEDELDMTVSPCSRVSGLDGLSEAKHAVSVLVTHSNEEVQ